MTHRGPSQPLPFCDSVLVQNEAHSLPSCQPRFGKDVGGGSELLLTAACFWLGGAEHLVLTGCQVQRGITRQVQDEVLPVDAEHVFQILPLCCRQGRVDPWVEVEEF